MIYFVLPVFWILWCFLHSYLISIRATKWFETRLGEKSSFYRLFYNLFSLITVLPLFYWQHTIPGPIVVPLSPYLLIFKNIVLIFSVIIVAGSFFSFDIWGFFGIRPAIFGDQQKDEKPVIKKHGFYGIVRHPMYLGGIIYFTASMTNAPLAQFFGYFILAVYMIIGTFREDRRLAKELGDVYRNYQNEVPMLLPGIPRRRN